MKNKEQKSKKGKAGKKDAQMVIRINKVQRDQFIEVCNDMDSSAAREVRRFIREFLKEHPTDD